MKKSFTMKLVALILSAAIFMFITTIGVGSYLIKKEAETMAIEKMRSVCMTIEDSYTNLVSGNWSGRGGAMFKGNLKITNTFFNQLYEE